MTKVMWLQPYHQNDVKMILSVTIVIITNPNLFVLTEVQHLFNDV